MTKRFFAFGCSYTNFYWPTWADILGQSFYNDYYNYGREGAGNIYIHNMLMQADQYHAFTKDDIIIVQWSSPTREDRYLKNDWITNGPVYNFYSEQFIRDYFDPRGYLIRDLALIKSALSFLNRIECEYYFLSLAPIKTTSDLDGNSIVSNESDRDVTDLYKNILGTIRPSFYEVVGLPEPRQFGVRYDSHKIPSEHYDYIKKVLPEALTQNIDSSIIIKYDKLLYDCKNFRQYNWYGIRRGLTNKISL